MTAAGTPGAVPGAGGTGRSRRGRPVGRRPGDPDRTRAQILAAARTTFGEVGFDRATIRVIAAAAEVDPALIIHHYATKQNLFAAAHELPFDPSALLEQARSAPADQRGEVVARIYLTAIGAPGSPALSLLRTAASNEAAARMMREFVASTVLVHAPWLAPGPGGELRLALAATHLMGILFARSIIGLDALARVDVEEIVATVAPLIQHYLDGDPGPSAG